MSGTMIRSAEDAEAFVAAAEAVLGLLAQDRHPTEEAVRDWLRAAYGLHDITHLTDHPTDHPVAGAMRYARRMLCGPKRLG